MRKRRKTAAVHLEQIQAQQLAELGTFLHHHRQHRGMSLEQVAAITKIPTRLLHAIEGGESRALPEPIYIQALLRRFAEALDLPGQEIAAKFPLEIHAHTQGPGKTWSVGQLRPIHLYLLYIFVIFSAVNSLSLLMSRSVSPTPPPELILPSFQEQAPTSKGSDSSILAQEEVSGPIREAFPLTTETQVTSPKQSLLAASQRLAAQLPSLQPNPAKPVQVKLTLSAQSWLRVTVDGETAFEGMMLEGSQRTWLAEEAITIRAGNAGGVLVAFNNQPAQQLGEPGSVKEVTYEREEPVAWLPRSNAQ